MGLVCESSWVVRAQYRNVEHHTGPVVYSCSSSKYHTLSMVLHRTTFTLDEVLADQARMFNINVSAAARRGVEEAVREAKNAQDRAGYTAHPEVAGQGWEEVEDWGDE